MLKTFFERNQDRKSEHRQTADPTNSVGSAVFLDGGPRSKEEADFLQPYPLELSRTSSYFVLFRAAMYAS